MLIVVSQIFLGGQKVCLTIHFCSMRLEKHGSLLSAISKLPMLGNQVPREAYARIAANTGRYSNHGIRTLLSARL
jgi:hypothetical protein